jgi:hypothetical protein
VTDFSRGVGGSSSEDRTPHHHTHNLTAAERARAALDGPRADVWHWDTDGSQLAGTIEGVQWMPDKYGKRGDRVPALVVELLDERRRVLVFMSRGLQRQVEDRAPTIGDGIAIERGEMVERSPLPSYREWIVEVAHAAHSVKLGGPKLPATIEHDKPPPSGFATDWSGKWDAPYGVAL